MWLCLKGDLIYLKIDRAHFWVIGIVQCSNCSNLIGINEKRERSTKATQSRFSNYKDKLCATRWKNQWWMLTRELFPLVLRLLAATVVDLEPLVYCTEESSFRNVPAVVIAQTKGNVSALLLRPRWKKQPVEISRGAEFYQAMTFHSCTVKSMDMHCCSELNWGIYRIRTSAHSVSSEGVAVQWSSAEKVHLVNEQLNERPNQRINWLVLFLFSQILSNKITD